MSIVHKIWTESLMEVSIQPYGGSFAYENDEDLRSAYLSLRANKMPVHKFKGYEIFEEEGRGGCIDFHICRDSKKLGTMETRHCENQGIRGAYVAAVEVVEWHRGKGVGYVLYEFAITQFNFLMSDYAQTPEARKIWEKLAYNYTLFATRDHRAFAIDDDFMVVNIPGHGVYDGETQYGVIATARPEQFSPVNL